MGNKDSAKDCYLGINGKKIGPMSEDQIKSLYEQNKITEDTKFIRAGMKQWTLLSQTDIIETEEYDIPPLEASPKRGGCLINIIIVLIGLIVFFFAMWLGFTSIA